MTDLTALTVIEIDTLWAPLSYATTEAYWAEADLRRAIRGAERQIETNTYGRWETKESVTKNILAAEAKLPALHDAWSKAAALEIPFQAEWDRRGGWTRAYLVSNNNGHVHRSTHCNTCFATTRFEWLIEQSGKDEAEIVELAGERACTICYPSAPVDILKRATKLFGAAEIAAQQVRAEKAAAKAAKDALAITVEGYREYGDSRPRTKVFKTERAATNAIAQELTTLCWYGSERHEGNIANIEVLRAALAAKGVTYDYDKALAAARKKVAREGGQAKY